MHTLKRSEAKKHYHAVIRNMKAGKLPNTSGEFIRAKLVQGKTEPEKIVKETRKKYRGSKAKISDVYWNATRLHKEGIKLAH